MTQSHAEKKERKDGISSRFTANADFLAFLLLGMGLRHFSMECARILPLKEFLLAANTKDAATLMRRIQRSHTIQDARRHILEYFADHDELAAGFAASQILCAQPWQSLKEAS